MDFTDHLVNFLGVGNHRFLLVAFGWWELR